MKSSVEKIDPTRVKLSIDAPYAELKPSIDEAYKQIAQQVNIPGFRRGKVPAKVIDQRIGRPAVLQEAVNNSLDGFYREALAEHELTPLSQPEVEVTEVPGLDGKEEGDLSFTIEVDVVPEIELPAYDSIEVEVEKAEITDADVDAQLDELRARFGTLKTVERAAKEDDFVTIDLTASVEDEEVDSAADISYQIGAGNMIDGIDEALTGLSADEETTFETTLAGGEHAGKTGTVKVVLKAVKERELPEADDDFAQLASEFDTIGELREDLRGQVEKQKEFEQGIAARDKVLEALLEKVEIPVPSGVVEDEVNRHLENEGRSDDDEHRAQVTEETTRNLKTQFLLDKVVRTESIEVSQPELIEYIIQSSQQYGMNPNEFAQAIDQGGQIPALMGDVARRKGLAAVLAQAKVVDTEGSVVDMTAFTTPGGEAATEAADAEEKAAEADEKSEDDSADEKKAEKKSEKKPAAKKSASKKSSAKKDDEDAEEKPKKKAAPKKKAPAKKKKEEKAEEA